MQVQRKVYHIKSAPCEYTHPILCPIFKKQAWVFFLFVTLLKIIITNAKQSGQVITLIIDNPYFLNSIFNSKFLKCFIISYKKALIPMFHKKEIKTQWSHTVTRRVSDSQENPELQRQSPVFSPVTHAAPTVLKSFTTLGYGSFKPRQSDYRYYFSNGISTFCF